MRLKRKKALNYIYAFMMSMFVLTVFRYTPLGADVLSKWDGSWRDAVVRNFHYESQYDDLFFIGFDKRDTTDLELDDCVSELLTDQFPCNRGVYAHLIEKLMSAGVRLLVLDIWFAGPSSDPVADQLLAEVLSKYGDKVILTSHIGKDPYLGDRVYYMEPYEKFSKYVSSGYPTFWTNKYDGLLREATIGISLSQANGLPSVEGEPSFPSLSAAALASLDIEYEGSTVQPRMAMNRNGEFSFSPISVSSVFDAHDWKYLLKQGAVLDDGIIFIGAAFQDGKSLVSTPSGKMHGTQFHLQVLNAVREKKYWVEFSLDDIGAWTPYLFGALLGVVILWMSSRPLLQITLTLFVLIFVMIVFVGLAYVSNFLIAGFVPLSISCVLTIVCGQALKWAYDRSEKLRISHSMGRHMSAKIAQMVIDDPEAYQSLAEGKKCDVVVMFADLRGFTTISEKSAPEEVIIWLNRYLDSMASVIIKNGGVIDKFLGDAVMASWGILEGDSNIEYKALETAQSIVNEVAKLSEELGNHIKVAVGLHKGEALVGELGAGDFTDFTIIGDTVNVASRIQDKCKALNQEVLCSKMLRDDLKGPNVNYELEPVGSYQLKGREGEIILYTIK